jgi:hypothetical protein
MKKRLVIETGEKTRGLLNLIIPESRQIKTQTIYVPTIIRNAKKVAHSRLAEFAKRINADFVVSDVSYRLSNEHAYCACVSFYSNTRD